MKIKILPANINSSRYVYLLRKKNKKNKVFLRKKSPNFEEHNKWFKNAISNRKHKFYVIKIKKVACGYIRLEKRKIGLIVSILIDKEFRRMGIATKTLLLIENKINSNSVLVAYVTSRNFASMEMFLKLGYSKITKIKNFYIMKKKLTKIKIIDRIEKIRSKNNGNWMNILRLAYKHSPRECAKVMSKIYMDDSKISKLVKKLIK